VATGRWARTPRSYRVCSLCEDGETVPGTGEVARFPVETQEIVGMVLAMIITWCLNVVHMLSHARCTQICLQTLVVGLHHTCPLLKLLLLGGCRQAAQIAQTGNWVPSQAMAWVPHTMYGNLPTRYTRTALTPEAHDDNSLPAVQQ
jgi:hypothetical protein